MLQKLAEFIEKTNSFLGEFAWGLPTVCLIVFTGVLMTIGNKFFHIRYFRHWVSRTFGTLCRKNEDKNKSDIRQISPFRATCFALASTIGTGNIAGVATAIITGGAGTVFWMWISAFFSMMTGYSETVLGMYYRRKNIYGNWCGGPMYYIREGLSKGKILSFAGKLLAILFSLFCILGSLGMGNMAQANTISKVMKISCNIDNAVSGIILAGISFFVIVGGINRIGSFAQRLVPAMALFYIICCLIIFAMNFKSIPYVFSAIFQNAFSIRAVLGAGGGAVVRKCITLGLKRGIFSNEAGIGSGAIAHCSSDAKEPVVQGMWSIFAVFTDTIIICTLTAFVILSTGYSSSNTESLSGDAHKNNSYISFAKATGGKSSLEITDKDISYEPVKETADGFLKSGASGKEGESYAQDGASVVTEAFCINFGQWAGNLLSVAIVLFAFSTIIGWSFYGVKAWEYLFGASSTIVYKTIYVACIVLGSNMNLGIVWELSDILNALMCIPNLAGILVCSKVVFRITDNYVKREIKGERLSPMISFADNKKGTVN